MRQFASVSSALSVLKLFSLLEKGFNTEDTEKTKGSMCRVCSAGTY
jgi:hypothetical protein